MQVEPEQAHVVLYWTYFDGREGGRRGHAYLHSDRERARFTLYEHAPGVAAKEAMMARRDTAAIWRSEDGGRRWVELPWTLGPVQRMKPSGKWCWPPEQVRKLSCADPLTIEWDDPWIEWEPGTEWRAVWDPVKQRWRMKPLC